MPLECTALIHHPLPHPPPCSLVQHNTRQYQQHKTHQRHRKTLPFPQASAAALTRPLLARSLSRLRSAGAEGLGGAAGGCASTPVESACVACPPAATGAHLASDGEQTREKSVRGAGGVPYGTEKHPPGGDRKKQSGRHVYSIGLPHTTPNPSVRRTSALLQCGSSFHHARKIRYKVY